MTKQKRYWIVSLVLGFCFISTGCDSQKAESKASERNVIRDYVNTPKNQARAVGNKLESVQKKVREQAKGLDDDE
jgi:hypothetical protein